jgi:hypothetical protein
MANSILLIKYDEDHVFLVDPGEVQRWYDCLKAIAKEPCTGYGSPHESCRHRSADIPNDSSMNWLAGTEVYRSLCNGELWCASCKAREALGEPLAISYDI